MLTRLSLDGEIDSVVDVNPYKQGIFMPGTGHQIVASEAFFCSGFFAAASASCCRFK